MSENEVKDPIEECNEFIPNMFDYIKENYQTDENDAEFDLEEYTDLAYRVLVHNQEFLVEKNKQLESMDILLEPYIETPKVEVEEPIIEPCEEPIIKDINSTINQLIYCKDDELSSMISRIPEDDINLTKISIYKLIYQTKKRILQLISTNPLSNISNYQKEIEKYQFILNELDRLNQEQEETNENETKYNIIFVPNNKNEACILDDIYLLIEKYEELKNIFEKLLSQQFMNSKGIKPIVSHDKLYEYKIQSGFRVLFINMGNNNLAISKIFYKDKQKSIKIEGFYEEAMNGYDNKKDYIMSNLTSPDFIIEQNEYIGQIRTLLESRERLVLKKKEGEK